MHHWTSNIADSCKMILKKNKKLFYGGKRERE